MEQSAQCNDNGNAGGSSSRKGMDFGNKGSSTGAYSSQKGFQPSSTTPSSHRPSAGSGSYMPPTESTPVTSHFDALLECLDLLRLMESDDNVNKQDVIDSLRSMIHNMFSTVMMHSFSTSMSVRGWRVE
jgi:hypothetical protein